MIIDTCKGNTKQASISILGILSPPGPFLTPSPSPSVQHSPRLQPSPSQSPFQQDVLLVTNNNQHFINTFTTTQEQVGSALHANNAECLNLFLFRIEKRGRLIEGSQLTTQVRMQERLFIGQHHNRRLALCQPMSGMNLIRH